MLQLVDRKAEILEAISTICDADQAAKWEATERTWMDPRRVLTVGDIIHAADQAEAYDDECSGRFPIGTPLNGGWWG